MKSSTLYHYNPLLLKADAVAEGGKKEEKKTDPQPDAKAGDKKEGEQPAEPELSPEELRKQQRELKDMTRGAGRGKKVEDKKEEKKVEKPADTVPAKTDDKKPDAKADEPKEPPVKPAPPKQPAAKREPVDVPPPIGDVDVPAKKSDQPEFKTDLELRSADKRKLQVLKQMEEDGTTPKGTAEKTLRFWEKESKYKEQWEASHPGTEFDEDAEEHQAWYSRNEVTYDVEEYENSRDNLVRREARKESEGKQSEQEKVQKRQREFSEAQKTIAEDSHSAVMEMIEAAAPELAALMGEGDAKALTKEITEKMLAKDPVVTEILQETAEELAVLTVELHRLTQFDDVYQANIAKPLSLKVSGRRIYPHADLLNFMQGLEAEMLKMDPQQTMRGKQRLVPNTAFNKEYIRIADDTALDTKAKREAIAQLNTKYYTLTEDDFRRGLIAQYADSAKREIEKFTKRAGHRTPKPEEKASETTQDTAKNGEHKEAKEDVKADDQPEEEEVSRGTRTRSPSSASASDAVDTGNRGGKEQLADAKSAVARSRGR